jgi:hypothetical protein
LEENYHKGVVVTVNTKKNKKHETELTYASVTE